ncbi:MAG: hypothetical protein DWQ01_19910 [Planctomycetota bacterium]|nr:MAG: hypothetical protein DWQ01_19910 [Planctomycetota bacterium]
MDRRGANPFLFMLAGAVPAAWLGGLEAAFLLWTQGRPELELDTLQVAMLGYGLVGAVFGLVAYWPCLWLGRLLGGGYFPIRIAGFQGRGRHRAWMGFCLLYLLALILATDGTKMVLGKPLNSPYGVGAAAFFFLLATVAGWWWLPRLASRQDRSLGLWTFGGLVTLAACFLLPWGLATWLYQVPEMPGRTAAFYNQSRMNPGAPSNLESPGPPSAERPDVVLVTLDTTRVDHLTPYGYDRDTSPHLAEFAQEAVRFDQAYAASSWTVPTHASMFTGLFPYSHGARYKSAAEQEKEGGDISSEKFGTWIRPLDPEHTTMAEILRAYGYRTGAFVAGRYMGKEFGMVQGFDWYDDRMVTGVGPRLALYHWVDRYLFPLEPDVLRFGHGYRRADEVNESVFRWLDQDQEGRHFLFVNYFDAHSPYWPLRAYKNLFPGSELTVDVGDTVEYYYELLQGKREADPNAQKWVKSQYDAELRFQDHHMGALFQRLKDDGRWDQSLVIVLADHGEHLGEHNIVGHGFTLNAQVSHIPLLVKFPKADGVEAAVRDYPVHQVDLLPTVLKRLGLDDTRWEEQVFQGRPLMDREQAHTVLGELYWDQARVKKYGDAYAREILAWVADGAQLFQYQPVDEEGKAKGGAWLELFDLEKDPQQETPMNSGPRVESLQQALLAWLEQAPVYQVSKTVQLLAQAMNQAKTDLNEVGYTTDEKDDGEQP